MFYKSKHDNTIIELIDSGFNYCMVIDTDNISDFSSIENKSQSTLSTQLPTGRILKYNKKEFKKHHKKIKSSKTTLKTLKPLSSNIKAQIIESFKDYKFEVLHDTEHFLLEQQKKQIKKEIEEQSEADRNKLLKTLAD